jgi:membrane fusion protein (multidrug efflux system)
VADIQTQIAPPKAPAAEPKAGSGWLVWLGAVLVAVGAYFALAYFCVAVTHESTDDAFIAGHVVSIAPRISGQVAAVHIVDNQLVHSNDLMIEIDTADTATTVAQKNAAADSQTANYQTVLAALELMRTKVETAKATALASQADADAMAATDSRAQADLQRAVELLRQKTISAQEYDTTQALAKESAANLSSARQKADADQSRIKEANAELVATQTSVAMELAKIQQAQADVNAAKLNLSYTKIFAPADGRVTRKSVEPGDYVQTGEALLAIVPADVWVVANFKESQLKQMKPGEHADVEIDALGGKIFSAHVDSIQAGSGAQFSLLPPENATGNFVKVVQRVPVKIVFDQALPADHTLGPGLSVTPSVSVATLNAPTWLLVIGALVAGLLAGLGFAALSRRNGAK